MDISETYMKMCEKAEDIQNQMPIFSKRLTSFFWIKDKQHPNGFVSTRGWMDVSTLSYSYIWLPRQDQLQEMILSDFVQQEGGYVPTYWLVHKFIHWLPDYRYVATSMEQLWLTFMMEEKYNKVWNGEEWVKE